MTTDILTKIEDLKKLDPSKDYSSLLPEKIEFLWREHECERLLNSISRKRCRAGRDHAEKYENVCYEILQTTLKNDFQTLTINWKPLSMKLDNYKRQIRDITLLMNPNCGGEERWCNCIWHIFKRDYKVTSLVFECKNYCARNKTTKMQDREVFQLFGYLSPLKGRHGKIGIFLTRDGMNILDGSAKTAINRIVDDEYRILIFDDNDMKRIIMEYINNGSPQKVFYEKHNEFSSIPL